MRKKNDYFLLLNTSFIVLLFLFVFLRLTDFALAADESSPTESPYFLSWYDYLQLKAYDQKNYTRQVRKILSDFEQTLIQKESVTNEASSSLRLILPQSFAEDSNGSGGPASSQKPGEWESKCIIGGVIRTAYNGKCPVKGRPCPINSDGTTTSDGTSAAPDPNQFLCGKIYNQACVLIEPRATISKRCSQSVDKSQKTIAEQDYSRITQNLNDGIAQVCKEGKEKTREACLLFRDRLNEINKQYKISEHKKFPWEEQAGDDKKVKKLGEQPPAKTTHPCQQQKDSIIPMSCLSCVYNNAMNSSQPAKLEEKKDRSPSSQTSASPTVFKASNNWIAMLTLVKELCKGDDHFSEVSNHSLQSSSPGEMLSILHQVGVCSEKDFYPYQQPPTDKGYSDWAAQFKSTDDGGVNSASVSLKSIKKSEIANWNKQFGITPKKAIELFCPNDKKQLEKGFEGYSKRLKEMIDDQKSPDRPDRHFIECAQQALNNNKKIPQQINKKNSCTSEKNAEKGKNLKNRLKNSSPIPVLVESQQSNQVRCVLLSSPGDISTQDKITLYPIGDCPFLGDSKKPAPSAPTPAPSAPATGAR